MKLAELRQITKGTKLLWNQGNGWYQEVEFRGIIETTQFSRVTFDELLSGEFLNRGRKVKMASIRYADDRGRVDFRTVNPRALRRI